MTKKRQIQFDLCFVGAERKPARFITLVPSRGESIRYEVRAGRNGKGRVLAVANCKFGYLSQAKAMERIIKKLGGFFLEDD
jgi:hypothetical protein